MRTIWDQVNKPPATALKTITGGRLNGMTDISPMWRIEKLTELFGPCGIGWKYDIKKLWREDSAGEILCFAEVDLYYKYNEEWSLPVSGIGGSKLAALEKAGLRASDEGYKMAVTDALSVACKALGFGAEIYAGKWDGVKYKTDPPADNDSKIDGLPEDIKQSFRTLKYSRKAVYEFCIKLGFNYDKIRTALVPLTLTEGLPEGFNGDN
jgi:hypothetical protein